MKFIDIDGDIWEEMAGGDLRHPSLGVRSREHVERMWGPLAPMNEDGTAGDPPAPEYVPWYNPGAQLSRCLLCGALVGDEDEHSGFHARVGA